MGQDHAPTAIPLQAQVAQSFAFLFAREEQCNVRIPLVTDHLSTREAANGDDLM